jgi:hypothetical protein
MAEITQDKREQKIVENLKNIRKARSNKINILKIN